jgi:glycosyltransferase involved in cell wall biosynthesis
MFSRILNPGGARWAKYTQDHFLKKSFEFLMHHTPIWWVPGHLTYLWMEKPPIECKQLGIIHAPDQGNLDTALKYHHLWDACVAVSEATADACLEKIPSIRKKLTVIPNGIEIPETTISEHSGELRILWCGRMEDRQKRVMDLVKVADLLEHNGTNWRLDVVGNGEKEADLKEATMVHQQNGRITLHGRLTSTKVHDLMESCDVVLLVSEYEGTPMVLLEGMARGCIPVSSKGCGGAIDMMQAHFSDTLFEIGDVETAANMLHALDQDSSTRYQRRRETLRILKTSRHTSIEMANAYKEVLFG